jgi:cysteine desulfurase / selenocysteine lyase
MINVEQLRQETPGCLNQIFFNNAGASLIPKPALKAMIDYLEQENLVGGYELAQQKMPQTAQFYEQAAILLNTKPQNIAFANHATDAYNKAISSIPFKKNDTILTTIDDYVSNHITFLSLQKRFGINIITSKKRFNNEIDFEDFEEKIIVHKPILVAVTHVPTNTGLIQNVEKVGELCQKHNALFLLDACQSVGQIEVDVQNIQCDFLTATGRKFLRGPRGTGLLYVSDKVLNLGLEPLFLDLHSAQWTSTNTYKTVKTAQKFESWELSHASLLGFATSLKYLNDIGIKNIEIQNKKISGYFREKLSIIENILVLDYGKNLSNIITWQHKKLSLLEHQTILKQNKICFSIAHKSVAIFDFEAKKVDWAIRFSPHYYNTIEEIDTVVDLLKSI